ncbi:MAG: hypothetical protein U5L76_00735 [Patescibacteria group bacterium]|nr:hypothetical protein [Patescibacteria group bacterium]
MNIKRLYYALYDLKNQIIVYGYISSPKNSIEITDKIKTLIANNPNFKISKESSKVFIKLKRINNPEKFIRNRLNLPDDLVQAQVKKIHLNNITSSYY